MTGAGQARAHGHHAEWKAHVPTSACRGLRLVGDVFDKLDQYLKSNGVRFQELFAEVDMEHKGYISYQVTIWAVCRGARSQLALHSQAGAIAFPTCHRA